MPDERKEGFPQMSRARTRDVAALVVVLCAVIPFEARADLDLKFYGDTSFGVRNHSDVSNGFTASRLELFPSASSDRVTFLAELMAESGEDNEIRMDLERVQIAYLFSNWLRARAGRMHTAFGYYNDGYHHGRFFELTTGRPQLVSFEDDGGLLVAHLVGVAIDGQVALGRAGDLHYDLETGNGRGRVVEEVAVFQARKSNKMVNFRLRFLPNALEGLMIGGNAAVDQIPRAAPATATDPMPLGIPNDMREILWGAHLVYQQHHVHFLAEGAAIIHKEDVTSATYRHYGGFVEAGYSIGDFTPYARYEHIKFAATPDPFYQTGPLAGLSTYRAGRIGVKWIATENIALKLEGETTATSVGPSIQSAVAQCAFGF
jgi:hypothetical protein